MSSSGSGQSNNPVTSGQGHPGQAGLYSSSNNYNAMIFTINQVLAGKRTATLVQIVSCTVADVVGPIGNVDVLPLVNLVDGTFNTFPHGTVHNLCYARVAGGPNGIICDPQPGDIGVAIMSDRDISVIKNTQKAGPPGSGRRMALADGIYLFPVLSKNPPTQYVRFVMDDNGAGQGVEVVDALGNSFKTSTDGITMTDKNSNTIVMDSDGIKINGVLFDQSQNVSAIAALTSSGQSNLGGGGQAVKLADGSNATKVKAT